MEKFLNILKQKIEDETAAFAILGAMIVTFGILIIIFECISYNRTVEVNGGVSLSQAEQKEQVSL